MIPGSTIARSRVTYLGVPENRYVQFTARFFVKFANLLASMSVIGMINATGQRRLAPDTNLCGCRDLELALVFLEPAVLVSTQSHATLPTRFFPHEPFLIANTIQSTSRHLPVSLRASSKGKIRGKVTASPAFSLAGGFPALELPKFLIVFLVKNKIIFN